MVVEVLGGCCVVVEALGGDLIVSMLCWTATCSVGRVLLNCAVLGVLNCSATGVCGRAAVTAVLRGFPIRTLGGRFSKLHRGGRGTNCKCW